MKTKKWVGNYTDIYIDGNTKICAFEINAEYTNGSFEGTVYENDFSGITNELVHVKGFIDENMISFVKTYPYYFGSDWDGKFIIDKNQRGHEVIYEGYFNHEIGNWSGEWEILISEVETKPGIYETRSLIGTWEMRLKEL